jgi:hypothetical protein
MADINIEKKRPTLVPWLLGLILLVLMVWGAAQIVDNDGPDVPPAAEVETGR